MRVWVNFKELREKLRFEDVLRRYKIEVIKSGDQHKGACPLPNHQGSRSSTSFSANLTRGIFRCFGCGAKGNLLDFAALMSGANPKDGDALRSVAVELQQQFFPRAPSQADFQSKPEVKGLPVRINEPLDFELKSLDYNHPYLAGRGFSKEIIRHFGIGVCSRGVLQGRLAIPFHNNDGRLLGYAGRVVDDATISDENPPSCLNIRSVMPPRGNSS